MTLRLAYFIFGLKPLKIIRQALIRHLPENSHHLRVKLSAGIFIYYAKDNILLHFFAVGPVRGHGVITVGNGQYPCQFRNLFSFKAIGISRAVKTFVMMPDNFRFSAPQTQFAYNISADDWMLFYFFVFIFGQ